MSASSHAKPHAEPMPVPKPVAAPKAPNPFQGERTIAEFWPSLNQSNASNTVAANLPLGLGVLVYIPAYVAKAANIFSAVRYTLTNRRLRLDKGVRKATAQYVLLEQIQDIGIKNENSFTRTGDLEILVNGRVEMTLVGVRDPKPASQTILDAVHARVQVDRILADQKLVLSA